MIHRTTLYCTTADATEVLKGATHVAVCAATESGEPIITEAHIDALASSCNVPSAFLLNAVVSGEMAIQPLIGPSLMMAISLRILLLEVPFISGYPSALMS